MLELDGNSLKHAALSSIKELCVFGLGDLEDGKCFSLVRTSATQWKMMGFIEPYVFTFSFLVYSSDQIRLEALEMLVELIASSKPQRTKILALSILTARAQMYQTATVSAASNLGSQTALNQ